MFSQKDKGIYYVYIYLPSTIHVYQVAFFAALSSFREPIMYISVPNGITYTLLCGKGTLIPVHACLTYWGALRVSFTNGFALGAQISRITCFVWPEIDFSFPITAHED